METPELCPDHGEKPDKACTKCVELLPHLLWKFPALKTSGEAFYDSEEATFWVGISLKNTPDPMMCVALLDRFKADLLNNFYRRAAAMSKILKPAEAPPSPNGGKAKGFFAGLSRVMGR